MGISSLATVFRSAHSKIPPKVVYSCFVYFTQQTLVEVLELFQENHIDKADYRIVEVGTCSPQGLVFGLTKLVLSKFYHKINMVIKLVLI